MQVEKNQNIRFTANIRHAYGAKKSMISDIGLWWETKANISDMHNEKAYALGLMNNKTFNPERFYNNLIKRFCICTKDFDFTMIIKKNKGKPKSIELKNSDGKRYTAVECRNFPLWIVADDLFINDGDVFLTKAASLLHYNEPGSPTQQLFNQLWNSKIMQARRLSG